MKDPWAKPVIGNFTAPGRPAAAPAATTTGTKCSGVGSASREPGARRRKSSNASTSPRESASPAQASNSAAQEGVGGSGRGSERAHVVSEEPAARDEDSFLGERRERSPHLEERRRVHRGWVESMRTDFGRGIRRIRSKRQAERPGSRDDEEHQKRTEKRDVLGEVHSLSHALLRVADLPECVHRKRDAEQEDRQERDADPGMIPSSFAGLSGPIRST